MSRKTYRICLMVLIIASVIGGVLFYRLGESKEPAVHKGVFVWEEIMEMDEEYEG